MFPNYCSAMGLAGWLVMMLVWAGLVSLAVWGIARLFPDHSGGTDPAPPPARPREETRDPLAGPGPALNRPPPPLEVVMHGTHTKYLLVAAGALVIGLLVAGTPVQALLPYVLLLACPLMMVVMMRGMGGHGDGHQHGAAPRDGADNPVGPKPR